MCNGENKSGIQNNEVREDDPHSRAAEALAKFERQVREEGKTYKFYHKIPTEDWDDGN